MRFSKLFVFCSFLLVAFCPVVGHADTILYVAECDEGVNGCLIKDSTGAATSSAIQVCTGELNNIPTKNVNNGYCSYDEREQMCTAALRESYATMYDTNCESYFSPPQYYDFYIYDESKHCEYGVTHAFELKVCTGCRSGYTRTYLAHVKEYYESSEVSQFVQTLISVDSIQDRDHFDVCVEECSGDASYSDWSSYSSSVVRRYKRKCTNGLYVSKTYEYKCAGSGYYYTGTGTEDNPDIPKCLSCPNNATCKTESERTTVTCASGYGGVVEDGRPVCTPCTSNQFYSSELVETKTGYDLYGKCIECPGTGTCSKSNDKMFYQCSEINDDWASTCSTDGTPTCTTCYIGDYYIATKDSDRKQCGDFYLNDECRHCPENSTCSGDNDNLDIYCDNGYGYSTDDTDTYGFPNCRKCQSSKEYYSVDTESPNYTNDTYHVYGRCVDCPENSACTKQDSQLNVSCESDYTFDSDSKKCVPCLATYVWGDVLISNPPAGYKAWGKCIYCPDNASCNYDEYDRIVTVTCNNGYGASFDDDTGKPQCTLCGETAQYSNQSEIAYTDTYDGENYELYGVCGVCPPYEDESGTLNDDNKCELNLTGKPYRDEYGNEYEYTGVCTYDPYQQQ